MGTVDKLGFYAIISNEVNAVTVSFTRKSDMIYFGWYTLNSCSYSNEEDFS